MDISRQYRYERSLTDYKRSLHGKNCIIFVEVEELRYLQITLFLFPMRIYQGIINKYNSIGMK